MILQLKAATMDYLWGGERLREDFGIRSDSHPLAEAWSLSCHPDGPSVVMNGPLAGKTLPEAVQALGPGCLGTHCAGKKDFPVLIKLIDARQPLSLQVHPDDDYAWAHEGQAGKTEMWLVLDCGPDAFIYYGFDRPVSREEMAARIADNTLTQVLRAVRVKPGDVYFIPAGTLHAIGGDMLVAEVQQNSNVTYRVYDYGRRGADGKQRELHIAQALDVTTLTPAPVHRDFGTHLASCRYFTVDRIRGGFSGECGEESFVSLLTLSGRGTVRCAEEALPCRAGDSFFLPARSGSFRVEGDADVLVTRV